MPNTIVLLGLIAVLQQTPSLPVSWVESGSIAAPEARQAAVSDEHHLYAITNDRIAQYDRETAKRLAISTGAAKHLNSGFFWNGEIYCAHSNYPAKPEQSEIKVLDPETMSLTTFKDFGESEGSLTWVVRRGDEWWCHFAYYGMENARSYVVRLTDNWKETGRWSFPASVIKSFGTKSSSGGVWLGDDLLISGHDEPELYALRLPREGNILNHGSTHPVPFPGQGFAVDATTGGLVGVNRKEAKIIIATVTK